MLILHHRRNGLMRTAQWCAECPEQWHRVFFNIVVDPPLSLFRLHQSIQQHNPVIPPPPLAFYWFCHLCTQARSGAFKGLSFSSRWQVCIPVLWHVWDTRGLCVSAHSWKCQHSETFKRSQMAMTQNSLAGCFTAAKLIMTVPCMYAFAWAVWFRCYVIVLAWTDSTTAVWTTRTTSPKHICEA